MLVWSAAWSAVRSPFRYSHTILLAAKARRPLDPHSEHPKGRREVRPTISDVVFANGFLTLVE